jgi:hypothetical protein
MARRHLYGGGIGVTGLFLAAVQLWHGLEQTGRGLVLAFEAGPFVLVALSLVYAGYWLARADDLEADSPRILAWGAGGVVLFVSVGALLLFSQRVFLDTLNRAAYVAIDHVTIGAVVGVLIGLYDARNQQTYRELERERDRVEAFGNKAADVNNYGRALNQCSSVDEVSALCIQAMQALLGVSEVAVLTLEEDVVTVIDDTILNVSGETLAGLGERACGAERAAVVTHEDVPDELSERATAVVTVEMSARTDTAYALVALTRADTAFGTEDIQLLELLTAHAGTAIDGITARPAADPPEGPTGQG